MHAQHAAVLFPFAAPRTAIKLGEPLKSKTARVFSVAARPRVFFSSRWPRKKTQPPLPPLKKLRRPAAVYNSRYNGIYKKRFGTRTSRRRGLNSENGLSAIPQRPTPTPLFAVMAHAAAQRSSYRARHTVSYALLTPWWAAAGQAPTEADNQSLGVMAHPCLQAAARCARLRSPASRAHAPNALGRLHCPTGRLLRRGRRNGRHRSRALSRQGSLGGRCPTHLFTRPIHLVIDQRSFESNQKRLERLRGGDSTHTTCTQRLQNRTAAGIECHSFSSSSGSRRHGVSRAPRRAPQSYVRRPRRRRVGGGRRRRRRRRRIALAAGALCECALASLTLHRPAARARADHRRHLQ